MGEFRYIDLSWDIEDKMSVHPYDSEVSLYQDKFLERDKYNNFKLDIGTHAGTHIDSPMHLTEDNVYIGNYDLERFCGEAIVIDVRGKTIIDIEHLPLKDIKENHIVLFYTGYDEKYGSDEYYENYPILDYSTAEVLIEKKIKVVGFDLPSPDNYPFEIHKKLLSNKIFIEENLRNLGLILDKPHLEVFLFPLKIKADASLIRAVGRYLNINVDFCISCVN